MPVSTLRLLSVALAAVALAAAPRAQVAFATFDDGDLSNTFTFSETNAGVTLSPTDDRDGTADAALSIEIDPAATGGFAGFGFTNAAGVVDASGADALEFYLRPTTVDAANLPLTLEINLHEDANGNGAYDGAVDDEFQATVPLELGSGYARVVIPLADFVDDNSVFPGANDGFDYTRVLEVVVAIGGPMGPTLTFAMDDVAFTSAEASELVAFDFFDDGDVSNVFTFSETNAGVTPSPTEDRDGAADAALSVVFDPAATGGFAGFGTTGAGVTDVSGTTAFSFQVRPTVAAENLPLTLEINLHEDANGNGAYDGAVDDEFQATYEVTGASDYVEVVIPISDFVDDNSVFPGANDGFDYSRLLEVVVAIGGPRGPEYTLSFDQFGFVRPATSRERVPATLAAPRLYPNPAAGAATVAFELAAAAEVAVEVVDLLGRRVAAVPPRAHAAGPVAVALPTAGLAAGVYAVVVRAGESVSASRLTVAR